MRLRATEEPSVRVEITPWALPVSSASRSCSTPCGDSSTIRPTSRPCRGDDEGRHVVDVGVGDGRRRLLLLPVDADVVDLERHGAARLVEGAPEAGHLAPAVAAPGAQEDGHLGAGLDRGQRRAPPRRPARPRPPPAPIRRAASICSRVTAPDEHGLRLAAGSALRSRPELATWARRREAQARTAEQDHGESGRETGVMARQSIAPPTIDARSGHPRTIRSSTSSPATTSPKTV